MHDFIFREINGQDIENELLNIGFDKTYILKASEKFEYKNIKIFNLTLPQANILKQTALSLGADCATHRETITAKIDKTDCILGGSISQLKKIADKLSFQPFNLKNLGLMLNDYLEQKNKFCLPKIVGILNLTKDSFSDGGLYFDYESAVRQFDQLVNDGADIIDIGAESTRPNFQEVGAKEQLKQLLPVLEYAKKYSLPISVDTRNSEVAEECIKNGVSIINDVSGLKYDKKMVDVISKYGVKVVLQDFENGRIEDIYINLKNQVQFAVSNDIAKDSIILDVGIGFGTEKKDNINILKHIDEFKSLGFPLMVGISRKSFMGLENEDNLTKDIYTLALNTLLIDKRVDFLRVHNVKIHKKMLEILNS